MRGFEPQQDIQKEIGHNLMPTTTLDIRLQVLNWLFAAIRPWLFQDQTSALGFPCGNDVDWKTVGDLAYFHNLEPVLFWVVSNNDGETDVPEWLKEKWEQAYFGNFLKNEEYFGVLEVLLDKCKKGGVSVIVFKGPALIGRIYKDPALRTLSDLDILCSRSDLGKLVEMAREMGYITRAPGDDPASTQHVAMRNSDTRSLLEFHFRPYEIIRNHQLFMETAWDRREWIEIKEVLCPVLSLETELIFNIAHIVQHQFDVPLKHLLDIAGLLLFCPQKPKRDEMHSFLRLAGLEQEFDLTLQLLEQVFDCPLSTHRALRANPKSHRHEFISSLQTLMALLDETRLMDAKGVMWNFRIAISNRMGSRNKLAYVVHTLLPFSNDLAPHYGIRSRGDIIRYLWRRFLFFLRRFIPTLANLPKRLLTTKEPSLAFERAAAKDRITNQLLRPKSPGSQRE